ncbi:MAG: DUF1566 domain-containing protein [Deltaproteobacteria bacterium]|nr:DUF1566 domain-containing protein [Deltaproteobacteria bacterium]
MKKVVVIIVVLIVAGCGNFTDFDGYKWYTDTGSSTFSEYGTESNGIEVVGIDSNSGTDTSIDTDTLIEIDTLTSGGTDTESIVGISTDSCSDTGTNLCEDEEYHVCLDNAVWCADVTGAPLFLLWECDTTEHCDAGPPVQCACNKYNQCNEGDVWQYSACKGIEKLIKNCDGTCEKCLNLDEKNAQCLPVEANASRQCADDGNVHWFDSCGIEGELIKTCGVCVVCTNLDDQDADCVFVPDFTECDLITSPDRAYDICIDGICRSPGCGTADCNVPGPYFPLADSGQRECFSVSGVLNPCPSDGMDYFGQDAQYGWDISHSDLDRFSRTLDVLDEPIVKDNVTGLAWQGCSGGLGGNLCVVDDDGVPGASSYTWEGALKYCDKLEWGGHSDWRLPDSYALQSIVNYNNSDGAVYGAAFPATATDKYYWSSSFGSGQNNARGVLFSSGRVVISDISDGYVRCVRSDLSTPRPLVPITVSGDTVVVDQLNSLMWQGCSAGQDGADCSGDASKMHWSAALEYCETLALGGYEDWRLPNVMELGSIANGRFDSPAVDKTVFPFTDTYFYWSSSAVDPGTTMAWTENFQNGSVVFYPIFQSFPVRCVRNEQ